jgi:hypothetical protein
MKIHFDHTDGGLMVKGDKLGKFSLAGSDHEWYPADARIDDDTVIVSSRSVPDPVAARYALQIPRGKPSGCRTHSASLTPSRRISTMAIAGIASISSSAFNRQQSPARSARAGSRGS